MGAGERERDSLHGDVRDDRAAPVGFARRRGSQKGPGHKSLGLVGEETDWHEEIGTSLARGSSNTVLNDDSPVDSSTTVLLLQQYDSPGTMVVHSESCGGAGAGVHAALEK